MQPTENKLLQWKNEAVVFRTQSFGSKVIFPHFGQHFLCLPEQCLTSSGRSLVVTEILLLSIASLTNITHRLVIAQFMNKEYRFVFFVALIPHSQSSLASELPSLQKIYT